ncbi:MAG: 50S ribosomal protein L15 [Candidatus Aminicenantes bacterium]|nr:50S ribosomal protein L15 [Candidatus Aminicenantes bacterium]
MKLSNLHPAPGSRKNRKRVGRGPGSGTAKTSGRGHKGQKAGTGYSRKRGFEGGQMPLIRRIPKRGFTNIFRQEFRPVNLDRLDKIPKPEVTLQDMVEAGLVAGPTDRVKVLGRGKLTSSKVVHAHKFSESAKKLIEAAGGQAVLIGS